MAPDTDQHDRGTTLVVGAGIGGLAAALRLTAEGRPVTVLDRAGAPGGKARQVDSIAGPVDTGPTVLTMRPVFDALFEANGTTLDAHLVLHPQDLLARHFWGDGSSLDLFADTGRNADAIGDFAGRAARDAFLRFDREARRLFEAFEAPMMLAAEPSLPTLAARVLRDPSLWPAMMPGRSLDGMLARRFADPRLRQLFGRYATYVGGIPHRVPALLSLIWQAEASGVWVVEGGISALARAMTALIEARGGTVRLNSGVDRIQTDSSGVTGVVLDDGRILPARRVIFNGDPRALATGRLGPGVAGVASGTASAERSLSAHVWAFAARPDGPDLAHHNVFFCDDAHADFAALDAAALPEATTLYVCAQDRGTPRPPPEIERFEIILNAPPLTRRAETEEEYETCHRRTFPQLRRFGLSFSDEPKRPALTTPSGFDARFPASAGSLYGQSPHGTTAALKRPRARTAIPGLWLCGGGCHPGAGVPMAALSGRHAAEAILTDRTSTSPSRRTATRGGTSTPSPIAGPARFPSSHS